MQAKHLIPGILRSIPGLSDLQQQELKAALIQLLIRDRHNKLGELQQVLGFYGAAQICRTLADEVLMNHTDLEAAKPKTALSCELCCPLERAGNVQ